MKNCMLIMILFFSAHSYAQEIPLPEKCFPLNGANTEDIISGRMADIYGNARALPDRFGANGKAVMFDMEAGHLSFPLVAADGTMRKEQTLTFWMYAAEDSITQSFWAKDKDGRILLGMGKTGKRAVLNIYHKGSRQEILPDRQWMWSDSDFSEGAGWYFVAVAYTENGTYFYLTTPAGKMTECYSAFTPDWNLISTLSIGSVDGIPANGMDDFKVYDVALSKKQVEILYQAESRLGMGGELLFNAGTGNPLYSSSWYLHCVGWQKTLRYVIQKQDDLSFLNADSGYALSMMPGVESDYREWFLYPVEDTAKGRLFAIANAATGMYLADTHEGALQQVGDDADTQKWYVGQWDNGSHTRSGMQEDDKAIPLSEEIYFDKGAGVIRVRINFPEAESVKVRMYNAQGMLLYELAPGNSMLLDETIRPQENGIYLVTVEGNKYKINKKISVNK